MAHLSSRDLHAFLFGEGVVATTKIDYGLAASGYGMMDTHGSSQYFSDHSQAAAAISAAAWGGSCILQRYIAPLGLRNSTLSCLWTTSAEAPGGGAGQ